MVCRGRVSARDSKALGRRCDESECADELRFFVTAALVNPRRRRPPRAALLVETTRTYTRKLLAGVRHHVAAHGTWSCFLELRALESGPSPWLKNWDGDGIRTRKFTQEMADVVASTGLPAVELRATSLRSTLPFVGMNNRRIGQMVADHFFGRGYRHHAAYSPHTERFFRRART